MSFRRCGDAESIESAVKQHTSIAMRRCIKCGIEKTVLRDFRVRRNACRDCERARSRVNNQKYKKARRPAIRPCRDAMPFGILRAAIQQMKIECAQSNDSSPHDQEWDEDLKSDPCVLDTIHPMNRTRHIVDDADPIHPMNRTRHVVSDDEDNVPLLSRSAPKRGLKKFTGSALANAIMKAHLLTIDELFYVFADDLHSRAMADSWKATVVRLYELQNQDIPEPQRCILFNYALAAVHFENNM